MTSAVKGKTREEAEALFERFHRLVTGAMEPPKRRLWESWWCSPASPSSRFEVKCASLSWHAMKAALNQPDTVVSTE